MQEIPAQFRTGQGVGYHGGLGGGGGRGEWVEYHRGRGGEMPWGDTLRGGAPGPESLCDRKIKYIDK